MHFIYFIFSKVLILCLYFILGVCVCVCVFEYLSMCVCMCVRVCLCACACTHAYMLIWCINLYSPLQFYTMHLCSRPLCLCSYERLRV